MREDMTLQVGGTTINIIAPKITEEERVERLDEVQRVIWRLWLDIEQKIQD
ncbi:hypothetical protein [Mechercharimyces sp. CAU 1602]|uniref:hypothetical protein n=1 Tax=Mechercharimyces sp. CAU 1602 TaxID=2973933 RepID=UPI002161C678|nr:hypothetical protein [Mechercharimyces sp. CAU 1602]MCS1350277.1 hypothetical protein [Mechercharimyces sp. CAU 1602]